MFAPDFGWGQIWVPVVFTASVSSGVHGGGEFGPVLDLWYCEATNTLEPAMGIVPVLEQRDQWVMDPDEHSDEDSIQPTEIAGTTG